MSQTPDLTHAADLDLARRIADAADAIAMASFDSAHLHIEAKPDTTFVTEADVATERAIRDILRAERPDDAILGEEFGTTSASDACSTRQWIIDPIDGTHNYMRGIPMWATLIALVIDGVPRVSVVSQPAIGRRWWAAEGLGAWTRTPDGTEKRIHVSDTDSLERASISFQSLEQWRDAGELDSLLRLAPLVWRDRGYGDAWPYMLLAEGRLEFVAEFDVKEYDLAAHVPIITEAGGKMTDFAGNAAINTGSSLATNGVLHDDFLAVLHADAGPA